jgi:dihydroxyacetone kinase-like predicted kinase
VTDLVDAATSLLDRVISDRSELVTMLTGVESDDATTAAITEWVGEHYPGVDVEVHDGGQPLYPYLFGVE